MYTPALFLATLAISGPWTKNPGEAYLKISEGLFIAGEFVDARARQTSDVDHSSFTTALYAEIGVLERFHLQAYLPHVVGKNAYSGGYDYLSLGAGDLIAGAQWTPGILSFPHALRVDIKLPLYGIAPDPRFPSRGDGQVDATVWLSAGTSFSSLPLYMYGEVGHRFRTELYFGADDGLAFGETFAFGAQVGLQPFEGFVVAANANGVVPWATDDVTKGYVTAGAAAAAPIAFGLSLEASFDGTVWALNSSRGLSFGLGVSYKR